MTNDDKNMATANAIMQLVYDQTETPNDGLDVLLMAVAGFLLQYGKPPRDLLESFNYELMILVYEQIRQQPHLSNGLPENETGG